MPRSYVALDLETTGLDPEFDAIMEVGAVRFDEDGAHERFERLVNPGRAIPYQIECLTGIRNDDVAGAPPFAEIANDVTAFIGDDPVVGQNVNFDLAFLARSRVRPRGAVYDTQELASVLLPDLVEQNLGAIARHLEIDFPQRHRALADADAARQVFLALRTRLAALPPELLAEAARIAGTTDWPLRHLLREVADDRPAGRAASDDGLMHGAVRPPARNGAPRRDGEGEPEPVDADAVAALLTKDARTAIEGFEERPEQVEMARDVSAAFNDGDDLLIEAGTGIGKSLAYLIPAARYALANDTRVVVSTNTINLQDQIVRQDIPIVQRLLAPAELRAAQLKGRRNYLCLLRWSNLRRSPSLTTEEAKLLVRLLLWLPHTDTGDRAELRLSAGEDAVWGRISAQHEACLATPCAFVKDGSCFLLRARRRAEAAHLLVVNHALTLSDLAVGGGVIPEYGHLVVDEAQHLEGEATSQFGFRASENDLNALLDQAGGSLVASVRSALRGPAAQLPAARTLLELTARVEGAVARVRELLPDVFLRLSGFVRQQTGGIGDYDDRLRLTRAMRVQPDWADVETAWENAAAALGQVTAAVESLHAQLEAADAPPLLDHEALVAEAGDTLLSGEELRRGISQIVLQDEPNTVAWLTIQRGGADVALASAPLRVAELLRDRLFQQKESTVLTSATLTAEGRFDFVRNALGLEDAKEKQLGSPFDYAASTIVLAPSDMPEPNQHGYMAALQRTLVDIVRASRGRALVLFTSHASLRAAYDGIKGPLEQEQILVLAHNLDGSPRQLTQALRDRPQTVVLGTASFWEGVDVVGEALSLLVIARLPFSVPDDPIFQARSELFDDPFNQYAVPQAVLRFKQGFGRLIRRKSDRGVMAVLDGRITSKAYGQRFLRSLPPAKVERIPLSQMPWRVGEWLGDVPRP